MPVTTRETAARTPGSSGAPGADSALDPILTAEDLLLDVARRRIRLRGGRPAPAILPFETGAGGPAASEVRSAA